MDIISMYPEYLRLFTRDDYADAFGKYAGECAEFFSGLTEENIDSAVSELMEYTDNAMKRRYGRSLRCFDFRSFFCVYLCPAANAYGTDAAKKFAELLAARWSEKHPDYSLEAGKYEDIASGFRTKPFGIDF